MALKFTKTQQKILDVLADGEPHPRAELWACIPCVSGMTDEEIKEFARTNTNTQLDYIRQKLRTVGESIICQAVGRKLCFRHIRFLIPPVQYPSHSGSVLSRD